MIIDVEGSEYAKKRKYRVNTNKGIMQERTKH